MIILYMYIIFFIIVLIILLCWYFKKFNILIINYFNLIKFLFFNIILLIYYCIYLIISNIIFIYNNYRFFRYYFRNKGVAFLYFNKKSIYFLFWRYLVIYVINTILFFIYIIINYFYQSLKNLFNINNFYLFLNIYFKMQYVHLFRLKNIMRKIYNFIIIFFYHFFNFINIDQVYRLLDILQLNIFNIFKYKADPIGNRNTIWTWSSDVYHLYNKNFNINLFTINFFNYFLNFKLIYIIKIFFYKIITYCILYFYYNKNEYVFLKKLLSHLYLYNYNYIGLNTFLIGIKIIRDFIHLILINIIYFICILFTYVIYSIFLFVKKFKYIFFYILLFLFCIKYYWIIYYYFFLLYQHYFYHLPLFEVKESTRFFNFEYIDLRNYFNLIFLHNTLIDISVFNNTIYNDLLNNLNKTLSVYGYKINSNYDLNLYALLDMHNKDTKLLNNLWKVFNDSPSGEMLKWYVNFKKLLLMQAQNIFRYSQKSFKHLKSFRKPFEKSLPKKSLKAGENSFFYLKREYLFHIGHKKNYILWKFFNKGYFDKTTSKLLFNYTPAQFRNLNKVPLRYIHLFNTDNYYYFNKSTIFEFCSDTLRVKIFYLVNTFKQWIGQKNYTFYLSKLLDYEQYNLNFNMKHKIPTFEWSATYCRRKHINMERFNTRKTIDDQHTWHTLNELANRKVKKRRYFKYAFIHYKYPFSMLKKKYIFDVLNNNSNINLKIIKKYYFIKNAKIYTMRRIHKRLYNAENVLMRLFIYRLNQWNHPFLKKQLKLYNNRDSLNLFNFWYFFDYFKTDKYLYFKNKDIYQNEESDINLCFFKRIRSDYMKLRNNLLRLYSLYFQYNLLERAEYRHLFINKNLPTFIRNDRIYWVYDNFKYSWIWKLYLTKGRTNLPYFKNVSFLSLLFKHHFFAYFVYCDYTINSYNDLFYIENKSVKLKVLNKINNLKRFFYFQNKNVNGWSIFKYINSFSLRYHIKKFLWHSPYSFLLFKDTFIIKNNDLNLNNFSNFVNLYYLHNNNNKYIKPKLINSKNYVMLFNLFLNVIEINNNWFYMLNYKNIDILNFYNKTFYHYYNNGFSRSVLMPFYLIDIYRFIMNFLFEYYNNFLYKLIRYRYVLDYKNYTFVEFCKRYINKYVSNWRHQIYPRIRYQIYRHYAFSKFIKWMLYKKLGFKANNVYKWRACRKAFLPFWFLFDYYIKLFIFYLLEKYYTKNFFVWYWLTWFNKFLFYNYYYILFYLSFFSLKFFLFKYFDLDSIFYNFYLNILNINNFKSSIRNIYFWYISIIFKFDINLFIHFNYIKVFLICKWFFLIINQSIFNMLDVNYNNLILIKIYVQKLINYYFNIIFNIKNALVYFKPNYYNYKNQRHSKYIQKMKLHNIFLKNTITYRNIYSFTHLTYNITFFKNLYLSNIYNYIYFMNMYNLNINNIFNTFFYTFKYNYMYFITLIYLLFYWFIFLILYIYYKNFYNIFFFTSIINTDQQYSWEKIFNDNVKTISKTYNNNKNKIWIHNKNHNFYKFNYFNIFLNKCSVLNMLLYKIINNKYHKNLQNYNNNEIIEIREDVKYQMWPTTIFYNYYNFFKNYMIMPFKIKKEGILYNFSFVNYWNPYFFNFCFYYWIIFIPYFFFEYILVKYYLKGHVLIKRKITVILKVLLDNFKWYINIFKYFGTGINITEKHKYPRNYNGIYPYHKKKRRFQRFFKFDRYPKLYIRLSPLGNYYYWFFKINKIEYLLSVKNYFFNFSIFSVYFYYINLYILLLIIIIHRYCISTNQTKTDKNSVNQNINKSKDITNKKYKMYNFLIGCFICFLIIFILGLIILFSYFFLKYILNK